MSRRKEFNYEPVREALKMCMQAVGHFIRDTDLTQFSGHHDLKNITKPIQDLTREVDVRALEIITEQIKSHLVSTPALIVSEEKPTGETIGHSHDLPDIVFLIDPIDNSDGAVHGDVAFSAITVYSREQNKVLAAAVCDPNVDSIYYADEDMQKAVSFQLSDLSQAEDLMPSRKNTLDGAYLALYTYKAKRFLDASHATKLFRELGENGRVQCLGGAASLCRVAAGYLDAAVEFTKGFQTYDLFPGAYILRMAKGFCAEPEKALGFELLLDFSTQDEIKSAVQYRRKFIAASTFHLYHDIAICLASDGLLSSGTDRMG